MSYRKIYEGYFGPIPVDEEGRTYDIHHIDRNRTNNSRENLVALPIAHHYRLHYEAGEFRAANAIGLRMGLTPKQRSELAKKAALERVRKKDHHFLGGEIQSRNGRAKVASGEHHFLGEAHSKRVTLQNETALRDGTHNFQNPAVRKNVDRANQRRLADGSHPFAQGAGAASSRARIKEGTHHFQDRDRQLELSARAKQKNSIRVLRSCNSVTEEFESISAAVLGTPNASRKLIDKALKLGTPYLSYYWTKRDKDQLS